MDAGSLRRTLGLSVSLVMFSLHGHFLLCVQRLSPYGAACVLLYLIGYLLHELLYPFGSFISFLIPGTVISGGECKDPGSY